MSNIQPQGKVPKWITEFIGELSALFSLEEFIIYVEYITTPEINRILTKNGYGKLDKTDLASVIVDNTYLTATVLIKKPLRKCRYSAETIAHEIAHIFFRSKIFFLVEREVVAHYVYPDYRHAMADILLGIEERACEQFLRACSRLGLFDKFN